MKASEGGYTDIEIIEGIKNNESRALECLYRLNRESFFNYVRLNSGNDDDAKDVLQDAVIVVHEKVIENKLVLTSSLKTYLTAVCNNLWYKKLRGMGKEVAMPEYFNYAIEDIDTDNEEMSERESKLMQYFDRLGEKCKELLTERFWKNKKMAEIADETDKNIQAVKMESSRCIEKLSRMYQKTLG